MSYWEEREHEERIKKNKALYEKYGDWVLYTNRDWDDNFDIMPIDPKDEANFETSILDVMEPGWAKAFGMLMIEELAPFVEKAGLTKTWYAEQIKEKYAMLCYYHSGATDEINQIIHKYEYISEYICGHCGRPDVGQTKGWYYPMCETCYGRSPSMKERTVKEIHECYIAECGMMGVVDLDLEKSLDEGKKIYNYYNRIPDYIQVNTYAKGQNATKYYWVAKTANKIRDWWNDLHPNDKVARHNNSNLYEENKPYKTEVYENGRRN